MLNHIVLMGRLTNDPELRTTQNGAAVATFTLVCDRDFKPQNGQREADLINCVAWRGVAEFTERNFVKGQLAAVSGRLQIRSYEKEGQRHSVSEVVVDNIYFAGPKPGTKEVEEADDEELPF